MVGQVVVTVPPDSHADEPAKRVPRMFQAFRCMRGMQIENRTCVGLLRPGQETLVVFLDQADGAVNQFYIVPSKILADFRQKGFQRFSSYVNLSDDFRGRLRMQLTIDLQMIVLRVDTELMSVGPINLAIGREIVVGIAFECLILVSMNKVK